MPIRYACCVQRRITESDKETMRLVYAGGASAKVAGAATGFSEAAALIVLRQAGLVRPMLKGVDHHYFDAIDSAEKAYWLGWLLADGCIRPASRTRSGYVRFHLMASDRAIIERFCAAVKSTHHIYDRPNGGSGACGVEISSQPMVYALGRLGVVPRKSFVVVPPRLPHELQPHMWRGVFEGNGHIHIRRDADGAAVKISKGSGNHQLRLCGSFATCQAFMSFVIERAGGLPVKAEPGGRNRLVGTITLGTYRGAAIAKALYQDATDELRLERKYKLALELIRYAEEHPLRH